MSEAGKNMLFVTCNESNMTGCSFLVGIESEVIMTEVSKSEAKAAGALANEKSMSKTGYLVTYIIAFACLIIMPMISKQLAPMTDNIDYGALRHMFEEIITCVGWSLAIIVITIVCKKKYGVNVLLNKKTKGQELPVKRVLILGAIVIASIFLISAQIGFQVKPFYDMGLKITGYELMGKEAELFKYAIKCAYIVLMIRCAQKLAEEMIGKGRSKMIWGGLVVCLTVGVFDLIVGNYTLPLTYFLLNLVYGAIFLLTDKSVFKTYLMVLLIYLL